tara:strand:+ start:58 stop:432 length:375 start_codon:yes stop_codon:yes gene_type:complete
VDVTEEPKELTVQKESSFWRGVLWGLGAIFTLNMALVLATSGSHESIGDTIFGFVIFPVFAVLSPVIAIGVEIFVAIPTIIFVVVAGTLIKIDLAPNHRTQIGAAVAILWCVLGFFSFVAFLST